MKVSKTSIEGILIIDPIVHGDDRGYFLETFSIRELETSGYKLPQFVQDNESRSKKDVLRGLHFQSAPHTQAKLVRVITGAVLDVCVDVRPDSATFGKHISVELNEENKRLIYIPEGFAHGFKTLRDDTIFSYKCSNYYQQKAERILLWNDPMLEIDWKIDHPIVSEKDNAGTRFQETLGNKTTSK